jgi:hypothetical protein
VNKQNQQKPEKPKKPQKFFSALASNAVKN